MSQSTYQLLFAAACLTSFCFLTIRWSRKGFIETPSWMRWLDAVIPGGTTTPRT